MSGKARMLLIGRAVLVLGGWMVSSFIGPPARFLVK